MAIKKNRGRPKRRGGPRVPRVIRWSEEEWQAVRAAAKRAGVSVSVFVRRASAGNQSASIRLA